MIIFFNKKHINITKRELNLSDKCIIDFRKIMY